MNIDSEEYTTASEAARLLGVSPQRVAQMAEDGALAVARPWPHVVLVSRRSIAEWLAGHRQPRIGPGQARRWLLKRTGASSVQTLDLDVIQDLMLEYITEARPRWDKARLDLWALETAGALWRSGSTDAS